MKCLYAEKIQEIMERLKKYKDKNKRDKNKGGNNKKPKALYLTAIPLALHSGR